MNKKHDCLGLITAIAVGIASLVCLLLNTFFPRVILPNLNAVTLITISLVSLLADFYVFGGSMRNYKIIPLYSALSFGIFPLAVGMVAPLYALKLAFMGAVIFTVTAFIFDFIIDRLSSGQISKLAPLVSAFVLFLAVQCFIGII